MDPFFIIDCRDDLREGMYKKTDILLYGYFPGDCHLNPPPQRNNNCCQVL